MTPVPQPRSARRLLATGLALGLALGGALARAGEPPAVGAAAPEFRLQDQNGTWHTLAENRGRWVVLYFYPKDATPGCTTEACQLRDNIVAFRKLNAVVLGVSVDDVDSHRAFAAKHSLPFSLLSDSDKRTAAEYGVLVRMLGIFELAQRDTFIVDPQGRIAKHWAKVDPDGHSELVLKELAALEARAAPAADAAGPAPPRG
jgi:peroxiredoxin Q/BCP